MPFYPEKRSLLCLTFYILFHIAGTLPFHVTFAIYAIKTLEVPANRQFFLLLSIFEASQHESR